MAQTPKATRQYVAITWDSYEPYSHRAEFFIVNVSEQGEDKSLFLDRTENTLVERYWGQVKPLHIQTYLKNLFVVSLSVAKRSYSKAWREYQESLQLEQATKDTEGYSGNELYQALR